jgi:hypothetical protein
MLLLVLLLMLLCSQQYYCVNKLPQPHLLFAHQSLHVAHLQLLCVDIPCASLHLTVSCTPQVLLRVQQRIQAPD